MTICSLGLPPPAGGCTASAAAAGTSAGAAGSGWKNRPWLFSRANTPCTAAIGIEHRLRSAIRAEVEPFVLEQLSAEHALVLIAVEALALRLDDQLGEGEVVLARDLGERGVDLRVGHLEAQPLRLFLSASLASATPSARSSASMNSPSRMGLVR